MKGDITDQVTDAIVNAANPGLMGGGGVDGAIHRRGGPRILDECRTIRKTSYPRGLPTGEAVITTAGNLKARFVIHTVGPVWRGGGGGESELLANAYRNSLRIALEKGLSSISFPSISTGAYGYPVDMASRVALQTVKEFLESNAGLKSVVFVLFSDPDLHTYEKAMKDLWANSSPPLPDGSSPLDKSSFVLISIILTRGSCRTLAANATRRSLISTAASTHLGLGM